MKNLSSTVPSVALAESVTRSASRQSWLTIRLLADPAWRDTAFRIYAYFRWIDDMLDEVIALPAERVVFVARQRALLQCALGAATDGIRSDKVPNAGAGDALVPQEAMLLEMVAAAKSKDREAVSRLALTLESMYAVMEFDALRRWQFKPAAELEAYTRSLSVSVTEALHLCIGHGKFAPQDESRYSAVVAACYAHMLRDQIEDARVGYFNVPAEVLKGGDFALDDARNPLCRAWVRDRVGQCRALFATGKGYLNRVENRRCRIAGCAYVARFEWVLDVIEHEGYILRADYSDRKRFGSALTICGLAAGAYAGDAWTRLRHPLAAPTLKPLP